MPNSNPDLAYVTARQKLWAALGFTPNKDNSGNLNEGDLYRVPKVIFEDDTPPKALLKRMLGKTPTSTAKQNVLNAILGNEGVIASLAKSRVDSKFSKIKQALVRLEAWPNASNFTTNLVNDQNGQNKKQNREEFKLLLKEYLKKATTRTFKANGRDTYRGDRILCCLLLLHYMAGNDATQDNEIVYYANYLSKNKDFFVGKTKLLKQACSDNKLAGAENYFTTVSRKKLAYYDVVLPDEWFKDPPTNTSDFHSIKKIKSTFDELSTGYTDIAWNDNTVSTSEDRLKITKLFVAAHYPESTQTYIVFADNRDSEILSEISKALFTGTYAQNPVKSTPDPTFIHLSTVKALSSSFEQLAKFSVFNDKINLIRSKIENLNGKSLHYVHENGKTSLRLLKDYETILEQMKMLISLNPTKSVTFLNQNEKSVANMLDGNPLPKNVMDALKECCREANTEQIYYSTHECKARLGGKIYAENQKADNANTKAQILNIKATWYSYLYPNGHIDISTGRNIPINQRLFNILCGAKIMPQDGDIPQRLIESMKMMGFQCQNNNNAHEFLRQLREYQNVRGANGIPQFVNKDKQNELTAALKQRKQSEELSAKLNNNYLQNLEELNAFLKTQATPKEKLEKFHKCIESYYKFDWINSTEADFQKEILNHLLYDQKTGELTQMVKDLVKDVPKVKTVTGADLKREAEKSTPQPINDACANYITMLTTNQNLTLNNNQRFIPGQELFTRINEALPSAGLTKDDILEIGGTASQTNGCESVNLNHAKISEQTKDRTQGPAFNATSIKGTIKREEMYETGELKDCDTAAPLIEKLASMGVIERVDNPPSIKDIGTWIPTDQYYNTRAIVSHQDPVWNGKHAFYCNGYIQPAILNAQGEIQLMEAMAYAPCSYMSQENTTNSGDQNFIQNFAAAFSYQNVYNDSDSFTLPQIMMNLMWVYPQYDNVLKDALRQSAKHPTKKLVIVHMPDIGQGAFGNPPGLTGLSLVLATIVNIDKLTNSNIILQRNSIEGLDSEPATTLYNALKQDANSVANYAKKLDKKLVNALNQFNRFSHLITQRAIAFGYLDQNGNYNIPAPAAPQGQQPPQYQQYQQYQQPNPQMPNNMQYRP